METDENTCLSSMLQRSDGQAVFYRGTDVKGIRYERFMKRFTLFTVLYNQLIFEQDVKGSSKSSSSAANVAFVGQGKTSTNRVSSGSFNPGSYASSSNNKERDNLAGFADEGHCRSMKKIFMVVVCTAMFYIVYRTTIFQHSQTELDSRLHPFLTSKVFSLASTGLKGLPGGIVEAKSDLELKPLWWFAKRFLYPASISLDDYVFLWDEDLGVQHFNPRRRVYDPNGSVKCTLTSKGPPCTGMAWFMDGEQENVLQECVNQLETAEKTRSSLISQLKEALQDHF
ncbi:hypothetical protein CTI12_AA366960 [Artemisia annua]|uniref:Uncharacterized protein n=1 Tax=Artemisia annua TaxID=35608 RepID=A0A2U1MLN8_ARTAN|nr:hypothetical protein CTI12_AA366960 [Artemisia annua]